MRGSVWQLHKKRVSGFIIGEDGCEIYFDRDGLNGTNIAALSVGQWVEFDLQHGPESPRATNIKVLGRGCAGINRGTTNSENANPLEETSMIEDYLLPGQLAARCGLSEKDLENYERHGVIRGITKNKRRYYSARDCIRLQQILRLMREKGLSLEEARELLEGRRQLSYLIRHVGEA